MLLIGVIGAASLCLFPNWLEWSFSASTSARWWLFLNLMPIQCLVLTSSWIVWAQMVFTLSQLSPRVIAVFPCCQSSKKNGFPHNIQFIPTCHSSILAVCGAGYILHSVAPLCLCHNLFTNIIYNNDWKWHMQHWEGRPKALGMSRPYADEIPLWLWAGAASNW